MRHPSINAQYCELVHAQVPGPACPASFNGLKPEAPSVSDGLFTYTCAAPGEVSLHPRT